MRLVYFVGPFVVLRARILEAGFVSLANVRSASLTARAFGNISATSGSSSTTLVPSPYRAAVTPRTAFEKSYSGRIVSSNRRELGLVLSFFIVFSFRARRLTGTDDSSSVLNLGVTDDQRSISFRQAEDDVSSLRSRVAGISHVQR